MNSQPDTQSFPAIAKWLGYGGTVPFVGLALSLVTSSDLSAFGLADAGPKLLAYAAVIISFIGAVHWGIALGCAKEHQTRLYIYSVMPALFAWLWMFVPGRMAFIGMALTIVAMYFIDRKLLLAHVPSAYLKMRLHLTVIVSVSLLVAALFAK